MNASRTHASADLKDPRKRDRLTNAKMFVDSAALLSIVFGSSVVVNVIQTKWNDVAQVLGTTDRDFDTTASSRQSFGGLLDVRTAQL